MGDPARTSRCSVSVYYPSGLSGRIVIESMSLFGTFRTCRDSLTMSAHRGKADIPPLGRDFRFGPTADQYPPVTFPL